MYLFLCVLLEGTATFVCGNSGPLTFYVPFDYWVSFCVCLIEGLDNICLEEFGTCSIILIIVSYDKGMTIIILFGGVEYGTFDL